MFAEGTTFHGNSRVSLLEKSGVLLCALWSVHRTFSWCVYLSAKAYRAVWLGIYTVTIWLSTTADGPFLFFGCMFIHFAIGGDEGEAQPSGSFHFDLGVERACSASVGGNLSTAHYLGHPSVRV